MADHVTLRVVGQDKVLRQLDPAAVNGRVRDAMDIVVNDAASHFAESSPVGVYGHAQGAWLQTKGVEVTTSGVLGFSDPTPTAPYVWYVIYGRKPGKMPPPIALLRWVWIKLGVTGFAARAVAWNVARAIGRRGTKPNDFITPIVEKRTPIWQRILEKALTPEEGRG